MDNQNPSQSGEFQELQKLKQKLNSVQMPQDLREKAETMISRAEVAFKYHTQFNQFDAVSAYIDWISQLPWQKKTADNLDIKKAQEILDKYHYGLTELKDRILEYLSVMKLNLDLSQKNPEAKQNFNRAPILCFVGLVGTGKTTIAISIAEAMGRSFARIPVGGMGDPLDLRGLSRMHPEAEPGKVIKAVKLAGTRNPVILLDEIDRVADEGRSSIMGVLVELLDPKQNHAFTDQYIDAPVDLSQVLFIATANNTNNIATAVLARIEVIQMPSYSDAEKMRIVPSLSRPHALRREGEAPAGPHLAPTDWPSIV